MSINSRFKRVLVAASITVTMAAPLATANSAHAETSTTRWTPKTIIVPIKNPGTLKIFIRNIDNKKQILGGGQIAVYTRDPATGKFTKFDFGGGTQANKPVVGVFSAGKYRVAQEEAPYSYRIVTKSLKVKVVKGNTVKVNLYAKKKSNFTTTTATCEFHPGAPANC